MALGTHAHLGKSTVSGAQADWSLAYRHGISCVCECVSKHKARNVQDRCESV